MRYNIRRLGSGEIQLIDNMKEPGTLTIITAPVEPLREEELMAFGAYLHRWCPFNMTVNVYLDSLLKGLGKRI